MRRISGFILSLGTALVLVLGSLPERSIAASAERTGSAEVHALLVECDRWGTNYNLLRDVMDLHGWKITVTGVTASVSPCVWSSSLGGTAMSIDVAVTSISDLSPYDCLVIMPSTATSGDSHAQLLADPEAIALVQRAAAEGLLVTAFCGGVRVLAAADLLSGVKVTGHSLYQQEYIDAGAIWMGQPRPPVLDGNILTCVRTQFYCQQVVETMETAIDSLRVVRASR